MEHRGPTVSLITKIVLPMTSPVVSGVILDVVPDTGRNVVSSS